MDWSKFSDQDLVALKKGDYGSLSNDALLMLKSESSTPMAKIASEAKAPPVDFSWRTMAENAPASGRKWAQETLEGMKQLVTSPVETAKSVGNVALGGVQKLARMHPDYAGPTDPTMPERSFEGLTGHYGQRYGDWDQFKQTMMEDPVGVLSDASTALFAASGPLKAAGKVVGSVPKAQGLLPSLKGVGDIAGKTAAALDPVNLAWNATARPVGRLGSWLLPNEMPQNLWLSATKLPTAMDEKIPGTRMALAETALKNKIKPSRFGITKLDKLLRSAKHDVNQRLDAITKAGEVVQKEQLVKYFDDLVESRKGTLYGAEDIAEVEKIKTNFLAHIDDVAPDRPYLTPKEVQKFKVDAWKQIGSKGFGERSLAMNTEAEKAAGRGAREGLEQIDENYLLNAQLGNLSPTATPRQVKKATRKAKRQASLEDMNTRLGELSALRKALPKPTGRIENLNIGGLSIPIGIGSGAAAGGMMFGPVGAKVGAAAGAVRGAIDNPGVKLRMAQGIYNAQNASPLSLVPKRQWTAMSRQLAQEADLIRQIEEDIAKQQKDLEREKRKASR